MGKQARCGFCSGGVYPVAYKQASNEQCTVCRCYFTEGTSQELLILIPNIYVVSVRGNDAWT
jgi:hypothetical protein